MFDEAVVVRVKVEVAGFAPGVTLAGENVQLLRRGRPEHESVTAESNELFAGVTVTV